MSEKNKQRGETMSRTKEELLKHYGEHEPTDFVQYDAFLDMVVASEQQGDGVKLDGECLAVDEDGDCLKVVERPELMGSGWGVRVLITPDLSKASVLRGLRKVADRIDKDHGERVELFKKEEKWDPFEALEKLEDEHKRTMSALRKFVECWQRDKGKAGEIPF